MSSQSSRTTAVILALLFSLGLALSACGGSDSDAPVIENPPPGDSESFESEVDLQEPENEAATFEEAELPEDFPIDFPIPDGARVASSLGIGGEDDFRVFFSLTLAQEEALAYYHTELPANNWTVVEEETTSRGIELAITNNEYSGELLFVAAEMGTAFEVHLYPLGAGEDLPDLPTEFGTSGTLGEGTSSFPSDFPIPSSFTAFELNDSLRSEGYELAFTYVGIAEMAMVELNISLMSVGWEMGEPTLEGVSGVYIVPFENLGSGFAGYAFITSNPGQFNMDTAGAALIALAPGQP